MGMDRLRDMVDLSDCRAVDMPTCRHVNTDREVMLGTLARRQSGIKAQPRSCNVAIVVSADTSISTPLSTVAGSTLFPISA